MKRLFAALLLAVQLPLAIGAGLSAKDLAAITEVEDRTNAAFLRSDAAGIADTTSERLMAAGGGRERYIAAIQGGMASARAQGIQVVSHHAEAPSAPIVADGFMVTVIKETTIMEAHGRRMRNDGFTVAVRPVSGGAWKLIGGNGIVQNPGVMTMLFPGFPADYRFPPFTTVPL